MLTDKGSWSNTVVFSADGFTRKNQIVLILIQIVAKSLQGSHAGKHIYGNEKKIWAGFGLIGNTEKMGADYEQLLRAIVSCSLGQIISLKCFLKYPRVSTEKLHKKGEKTPPIPFLEFSW